MMISLTMARFLLPGHLTLPYILQYKILVLVVTSRASAITSKFLGARLKPAGKEISF